MRSKYFHNMPTTVLVSGGTTDPSTTPRMADRSMRLLANSPATVSPSSSAVRSRMVWRRQLPTSSRPSNTPRTMFVLPTSIASSMQSPAHFSGDNPLYRTANSHEQRAHVAGAFGDAGAHAGRRVPFDPGAACAERARAPAVENSIVASV